MVERRRKPRIYKPFPATVRGVSASGEPFQINTVLDNLSAGGLYLRLMPRVEQGARLFIVIWLAPAPMGELTPPRVAARGRVLRSEPKPGGECGVAVRITRHRFL